MKKILIPHSYFNNDIYQWTLRMELNKWYSIKNIKMDKQDFINCITYLISIGEPLIFNNEMASFRRILTFKETVRQIESMEKMVVVDKCKDRSRFDHNHPLAQANSPERIKDQEEYWENFWLKKKGLPPCSSRSDPLTP